MLKLVNVKKDYKSGENIFAVLKGIDFCFKNKEFVSILGESGCGKTTLLNLIGGLDKVTSGDIILDGISLKAFKDKDFDLYRNKQIGFIFQNYQLIENLSVKANVEMPLVLQGVKKGDRYKIVSEKLKNVGLLGIINKKAKELSGGQKQRVAIARALVCNPKIILADEPTGALDSASGFAVAEILKELSQNYLVIMVTHSSDLANKYSDRIIQMKDGVIAGEIVKKSCLFNDNIFKNKTIKSLAIENEDCNINEQNAIKNCKTNKIFGKNSCINEQNCTKKIKTKLGFWSALRLSLSNLKAKKIRTFLSSFAASVGMIGIALVLFLGNGFSSLVKNSEGVFASSIPIVVQNCVVVDENNLAFSKLCDHYGISNGSDDLIYSNSTSGESGQIVHYNNGITQDYVNYVKNIDKKMYSYIAYQYDIGFNYVYKKDEDKFAVSKTYANVYAYNNTEIFQNHFNLLAGRLPENNNEAILYVSASKDVNFNIYRALNIKENQNGNTYEEFLSSELRLAKNNDMYKLDGDFYTKSPANEYEQIYNNAFVSRVVGIVKLSENSSLSGLYQGLYVSQNFLDSYINDCKNSDIVIDQTNKENCVLKDVVWKQQEIKSKKQIYLYNLNGIGDCGKITIFPSNVKAKNTISNYLYTFNQGKQIEDCIFYQYLMSNYVDNYGETISLVTSIVFSVSILALVISSIMIGILIYTSVLERSKEIGILKSIGAKRKDIDCIFSMESTIIGLFAGLFACVLSSIASVFINNYIITIQSTLANLLQVDILSCIYVLGISSIVTYIASIIPSKIASRLDPIKSLNN